jgi:hypothetical protein
MCQAKAEKPKQGQAKQQSGNLGMPKQGETLIWTSYIDSDL